MTKARKRIAATAAAITAATTLAVGTAATADASTGDLAIGLFNANLRGASLFVQQSDTSIRVLGAYRQLRPNRAYFTVIYANGNCDPAQAFPVGPFTTDNRGRGSLSVLVPSTVSVGGTMSVSVRRGDTAADQDGDGKTGPTDVVAVPGQPSVGLVECDSDPIVLPASSTT